MSKKNSSVILKSQFSDFKELNNIYLSFKNKLSKFKSKSFLVAISGGPDSLALVALSKALNYEKKIKFFYVLINHNIRKNSSQEAKKVKNILKKNALNLKIINNKFKIEKNIQGEARNIRYKLLVNFCKKNNIKIILTAHNFEDQVETFLIRLSRGSGLSGLSSMKAINLLDKKVKLFRPLLDIKKKNLKQISKKIFGKYINDPSNKNQKFLRSKIRNLKKPLEKSGIKYEQIFRSINNLSSSRLILDNYYREIFINLVKKKKKKIYINYKKFNNLENEIKIKVINDSIKHVKKNYYNLRSKKVLRLVQNVKKTNFTKTTLGGCIFFKKGPFLCLNEEK